ncbi:MAG: peptidylprolyl isomerase [Bacteroidota bacterium]
MAIYANNNMMRRSILFIALFLTGFVALQAQSIDKIISIVGEDVILKSDVEAQYAYFKANGQKDDGTMRCQILEKLIIEKLLLNKARQDSLEVTEEQVEGELQRKLDYFISGYGGVDKLEEIYRKPLIEIRADLRPDIKESLLIDKMRQKVVSGVKVTPREVKKFYEEIPVDSLPFLPAEVEMFHLVKRPTATDANKDRAHKALAEYRERIVAGKDDFGDIARKISRDFASAKAGGKLPEFGRGRMVPEFEEVAFKTKEGEVSKVFETDYGFHILRVDKRIGEVITAAHILVPPEITIEDDSTAMQSLRDIRAEIEEKDSLSFEKAAMRYTDDISTQSCGGCIKNPQTGEGRVPLDLLDADFYLKVDGMKEGEMTPPMEWIQPDGKKAFHILYLKRRTPPHIANLEDDYQKLQQAALSTKQATELERWFERARKNIYIVIKDPDCREALSNWIQ